MKSRRFWLLSSIQLFTAITYVDLVFAKDPARVQKINHKSWEIVSEKGETYLPDMFYSDAKQNFQIMPVGIQNAEKPLEDKSSAIDRLVYPTIGNPNLFIDCVKQTCSKASQNDALMTVLRIEPKYYEGILETSTKDKNARDSFYEILAETTGSKGTLSFILSNRHTANKKVYTIDPSKIEILKNKFIPDELKNRSTLKFSFDQDALKDVPAGLYDITLRITGSSAGDYNETQYNAVKVFKGEPKDQYFVISVTDTQVSLGNDVSFATKTRERLKDFVKSVNSKKYTELLNSEPNAAEREAAFIVFNGDLHNGGSPATLAPYGVATTYQSEARAIVESLKELEVPIFLTAGNHDGYVNTGVTPSAIKKEVTLRMANPARSAESKMQVGDIADKVLGKDPGGMATTYKNYLDAMEDRPGGKHIDIFQGIYVRDDRSQSVTEWKLLPENERNYMLYDGFNQWRRTYGPLYMSWTFKSNHYMSINSYDLRQHRRTGWGMYTVNYGGGVSPFQMSWIHSELGRATQAQKDIILLSHHDPRGGHRGTDYPYYFRQVDYNGMSESLFNYVDGEMVEPKVCEKVPDVIKTEKTELNCMHDGLQEWMRADSDFDCQSEDKKANGMCDIDKLSPKDGNNQRRHPRYSGFELLHFITQTKNLETVLLGHTHYHSFEIYKSGDALVPETVKLDFEGKEKYQKSKWAEVVNPFRWVKEKVTGSKTPETADEKTLRANGIEPLAGDNEIMSLNLEKAGHTFERTLAGKDRNLVIMRMTCEADLSDQKFQNNPMMGFSVFELNKASPKDNKEQINQVYYLRNQNGVSNAGAPVSKVDKSFDNVYAKVGSLKIEREANRQEQSIDTFKGFGFTK